MMPAAHAQGPTGARQRARAVSDEELIVRLVNAVAAKPLTTIAEIQKVVVAEFGFSSVDSMLARAVDGRKLKARQLGMTLCRAFNRKNRARGNGTLTHIARKFNRDRTAVREADRVYGEMVRAAIADLREPP